MELYVELQVLAADRVGVDAPYLPRSEKKGAGGSPRAFLVAAISCHKSNKCDGFMSQRCSADNFGMRYPPPMNSKLNGHIT